MMKLAEMASSLSLDLEESAPSKRKSWVAPKLTVIEITTITQVSGIIGVDNSDLS